MGSSMAHPPVSTARLIDTPITPQFVLKAGILDVGVNSTVAINGGMSNMGVISVRKGAQVHLTEGTFTTSSAEEGDRAAVEEPYLQ